MKCITLHFPLLEDKQFHLQHWLADFEKINRFPEVENDQNNYVNLNFFTEQPDDLWQSLLAILKKNTDHSVIVMRDDLDSEDEAEILYEHGGSQ